MSGKHGLDKDKFGYLDIEDEVEKLGFVSWDSLAYKVLQTMVFKVLHDDKSHLSKKCRVLSVYVDNGKKSGETSEILSANIGGDGAREISDLTRSIAREKSVGGDGDINEKPEEVDGDGEDYEDWTSEDDDDYMPSTEHIVDGSEKHKKHVGEDHENADWNSEEDDDYMPSTEDSEDILSEKELPPDDDIQTGQSVVGQKKIESEIGSDDEVKSDYDESDGEVNSDSTGDEADPKQKKEKGITYNPRCDHKSLKLCVGMRFEDGLQCREALRTISVENGYPIHFRRASKHQCEAICTEPCAWRCYGSVIKRDNRFTIKVLNGEHTCLREIHNKQATSSWICKKYLKEFRLKPNMTAKELEADIMEKYACRVTKWRCYSSIWKARDELGGSITEHYAQIRSYIEGVCMTCQRCLQPGHNIRSCKNEAVEKPEAGKVILMLFLTTALSTCLLLISAIQIDTGGVVIGKEMTLANKGVGVLVCEGTGNIYCRMAIEKRAHFVNPPRRSSRQAATRKGTTGSSSTADQMPTQESQT
ncbi:hypothetical protein C2S52_013773 [Perilla frutescens var. hirtella]|nr:hypothetical protein C2S52_013773 [Perilla frutescens var. hirtella]